VLALALGVLLPRITRGPQTSAAQVSTMLLTLGFGVLGVTAVIFSLLFLVVQWAHTAFSPRLTLFREAPVVRQTFALAISVAVFSIAAALTVGDHSQVSVAVPALAGALLLFVLAMVRRLQLQAFAAIQLAPVLLAITERGHAILQDLYSRASEVTESAAASSPAPSRTVVWKGHSEVLQQVDMDSLVATARHSGAVVVLRVVPGAVLRHGTLLAEVSGAAPPDAAIVGALVTGPERTFEQDPLLAFRLLADIVMRALSAAVNDPATAVQGLDCLEDLLEALPAGEQGSLYVRDEGDRLRVVVPLPDWGDFLRDGLDGIIAAAVGSPLVLLRIRSLLTDLQPHAQDRNRAALRARLGWVEQELAARFPVLWAEAPRGAG
jgi:uncharacterized membrane protein